MDKEKESMWEQPEDALQEDATKQSVENDVEGEQMTEKEEERSSKEKCVHYIKKTLWKDVLTVACITFFIFRFIGFRAIVPTGSMEPTLQVGKSYIVNRTTTYFGDYKGLVYEDVVVFTHEAEFGNDDFIVKRVIGLPGDVISIESGRVRRNGDIVGENYVINKEFTVNVEEFTVPDDGVFVLGDNRQSSHDGRFWEHRFVPLDSIVGEMILFS